MVVDHNRGRVNSFGGVQSGIHIAGDYCGLKREGCEVGSFYGFQTIFERINIDDGSKNFMGGDIGLIGRIEDDSGSVTGGADFFSSCQYFRAFILCFFHPLIHTLYFFFLNQRSHFCFFIERVPHHKFLSQFDQLF